MARAKKSSKKMLLIIEDEDYLADVYEKGFGDKKYTVHLARDGETALAILEKHTPDLIILDILLPKLDGFELLRRLKTTDKWSAIPVLVISNIDKKKHVKKSLELGAVDFIVKANVSLDAIVDKVDSILS